MFEFVFFILFTPGVSGFYCTSSDLELSYTFCETIETEFDIKGKRTLFPKGDYTVILQAFSDDSEQNIITCLNFTMIIKQDAF
ncbi:hypothetical protein CIB84_005747 [Bambusicola thoracicus]|uniref:MD-2-related lipid-recognition domain-containing protein n=1 Tax=Bambusicola thoracicus TaxID=9083 RepID=A0A2P4T2D3_BAMTH|nr:hypothetical protein CIB84_005747 [Bambusicola thoracicus]